MTRADLEEPNGFDTCKQAMAASIIAIQIGIQQHSSCKQVFAVYKRLPVGCEAHVDPAEAMTLTNRFIVWLCPKVCKAISKAAAWAIAASLDLPATCPPAFMS